MRGERSALPGRGDRNRQNMRGGHNPTDAMHLAHTGASAQHSAYRVARLAPGEHGLQRGAQCLAPCGEAVIHLRRHLRIHGA